MKAKLTVAGVSAVSCVVCLMIVLTLAQKGNADQWYDAFPHPSGRYGHRAVLDRPNQRMVLMGGAVYEVSYNDVWALECEDGCCRWHLIEPAGGPPAPRERATVVLNRPDHSLIVFGGGRPPCLNDVWKLTLTPGGETWSEITPLGPPPSVRAGAPGVYDPISHRMVLFGGSSPSGYFDDTWALDLTTPEWTQLFPGGENPSARDGATGIYDPVGHRMIIFGGYSPAEGFMNETWALSLEQGAETWTRLDPSGPVPGVRRHHGATYDWVDHKMLVHAGWRYPPYYFYNDVWALDLSALTWTQLSPEGDPPPACRDPVAVFFTRRGNKGMIVFGGNSADPGYTYYDDTYVLLLD